MITTHPRRTVMPLTFRAASAGAPPSLSPGTREHLQQAGRDVWRVIEPQGRVLGHLAAVDHPLGGRFVARRYHAAAGRFRDLGEFWSADDAIECLRHAS